MRVTVDASSLGAAAAWAALALPGGPAVPVLAGMVVSADDGTLRLSAFDYEVAAAHAVEADVAEPGAALVSGRLLNQIAQQAGVGPVTLSLDGATLLVETADAAYRLATLPIEDHPAAPSAPRALGTVDSGRWNRAVRQVAAAASRDQTLPVLTAVSVAARADKISLSCTDRYRIAAQTLDWTPRHAEAGLGMLVPAQPLMAASRALPPDRPVEIGGDGRLAGLSCAGRSVVLRVMDGEVVDYLAKAPAPTGHAAAVPSGPLVAAIKRMMLVAGQLPAVDLTFRPDRLVLSAGTEAQARATATVEAEFAEAERRITVNARYLLDGLGALDTATARFQFTDAAQATLISGDDGARYLLGTLRRPGSAA